MAIDPTNLSSLSSMSGADDKSRLGTANKPVDGAEFKKFLTDNLSRVNEMQIEADNAIEGFVTGTETDINKVMVANEKASMAFNTLMAVRNKLVESYQEILRMRV